MYHRFSPCKLTFEIIARDLIPINGFRGSIGLKISIRLLWYFALLGLHLLRGEKSIVLAALIKLPFLVNRTIVQNIIPSSCPSQQQVQFWALGRRARPRIGVSVPSTSLDGRLSNDLFELFNDSPSLTQDWQYNKLRVIRLHWYQKKFRITRIKIPWIWSIWPENLFGLRDNSDSNYSKKHALVLVNLTRKFVRITRSLLYWPIFGETAPVWTMDHIQ